MTNFSTLIRKKHHVPRMGSFAFASRFGIVPALALVMMSCMPESLTKTDSNGEPSRATAAPLAARTAIGSIEGVSWIRSLDDLRRMRLTGNYKLANRIDASSTANAPFVPVGGLFNPFQGTFDGNGFEIDRLTIRGGEWTGMFGQAMNALLKNVRLTNVNITGGFSTGAIAGFTQNVDLTMSYVTGTVAGNAQGNRIGMAIGTAANWTRVSRCYATGTVRGTGSNFGGLMMIPGFISRRFSPMSRSRPRYPPGEAISIPEAWWAISWAASSTISTR
jgi:hypothetical protein